MGEDLLKPKSVKFQCSIENPKLFRVKLTNPPKDRDDGQDLDIDTSNSLIVYQDYKKGVGRNRFRPHRWSNLSKAGKNLFLK